MTIYIYEQPTSRESTRGEQVTNELRYVVHGTDDDAAVRSLVSSTSPATYDGLVRKSITCQPRETPNVWDCSVRYDKLGSESQYTFDTGGGTQHVAQALEHIGSFAAPGEVAGNFKGAIGVSGDRVEGTDITVPVFNFSETHYLDDSLITAGYKLTLFALTGRVNHATWKGFAKGEVLFLGASGSRRGDEDWEITFRFAASQNVAGLNLGEIAGIDKEGWQYLWIQFEDDADDAAKILIKKPIAAHVERVYEYGNFANLGIGS